MDSPKVPTDREPPNTARPRASPTLGERVTSPLNEARPERPARFTEHFNDDNPAHAFEYSNTWKSLQNEEKGKEKAKTTSETTVAGPSTISRTVDKKTSRNESRTVRREGSRSALERSVTPVPPTARSPMLLQMSQPSSARRPGPSFPTPDGQVSGQDLPNQPSLSWMTASANVPRSAFEEPRPQNAERLGIGGSSQSNPTPRFAQTQQHPHAPPRCMAPYTGAPSNPGTSLPTAAAIPNITVSPPSGTIPPSQNTPGQVRFSDVNQSRQTVRTYNNADGTVRRHLSFRLNPTTNGQLGAVDAYAGEEDRGDNNREPISELKIRAERIRRKLTNFFASDSGEAPAAGLDDDDDWEPIGYWENGSFYEWRDRDWRGRPRGRAQSVLPTVRGEPNDKGVVSAGNFISRAWRKLKRRGVKRRRMAKIKVKGKGKERWDRKPPQNRNYDSFEAELQRYTPLPASSSSDGDDARNVGLGVSVSANSAAGHPGGETKKGRGVIGFSSGCVVM